MNKLNFTYFWRSFGHKKEVIYFEDNETIAINKDGTLPDNVLLVLTGEKTDGYGVSIHPDLETAKSFNYEDFFSKKEFPFFDIEIFKMSEMDKAKRLAIKSGTLTVLISFKGSLIKANIDFSKNLIPEKPYCLISSENGFYPLGKEQTEEVIDTHKISWFVNKRYGYLVHKEQGVKKIANHIIIFNENNDEDMKDVLRLVSQTVIKDPSFGVNKRLDWQDIKNCQAYWGLV